MTKLEKACEMSLNEWLATIPDDVPEAEYTENHEKWLKKLFNKMRDNRYHRFTTKTVKVLLVAAVLFALLLSAFVIPSSREFMVENFDIYGTYKLTEHNNNSVNGDIKVGYMPEKFELVNKDVSAKILCYNYSDGKNEITILKLSSSIKVEFDTETGKIENIVSEEITYTYFVDDANYGYLVWNKNDYIYQIHGSISKEELLKIAKTVK